MPSESCASKGAGSSARITFSFTIALSKSPALKSNIASSYCSCSVIGFRCDTLTHAVPQAQAVRGGLRRAGCVAYARGVGAGLKQHATRITKRMSAPIKLISTDFDGTLFAEFQNPPIPKSVELIIARLQARGSKWVINTG